MKNIRLKAYYEAPYFTRPSALPWKVAGLDAFQSHFLSADMAFEEIGLFVMAVAKYGDHYGTDFSSLDKDAVVEMIIRRSGPVVAGGVAILAESAEDSIYPGCCCGLEGWRDWFTFLEKGHSPWMGHDPSPCFAKTGQGQINAWVDADLCGGEPSEHPDLVMDEADFTESLKQVERDLIGFLDVLESWTLHEDIEKADELVETIDRAFDIRPDYMKSELWKMNQGIGKYHHG